MAFGAKRSKPDEGQLRGDECGMHRRRRVLFRHTGADDHASGLCAWPGRFRR
jgi:hypothetical protein